MSCASLTFDFSRRLTELGTFTHLLSCHFAAVIDFADYASLTTFCSTNPCFLPPVPLLPQRLTHSLSCQFID